MFLTIILLLILAVLVYIRLAPSPIEKWHGDPEELAATNKPNSYRLSAEKSVEFAVGADKLAVLLNDVAHDFSAATVLAQDADARITTYIARTKLMGYPDYISTKITAIDDSHAKLAIYSRSRFGRSDLGVNKKRVQAWLAALKTQ